jgi:hypothetical protein
MVRQYGSRLERILLKYMSFSNQDLAHVTDRCAVDGHSDAWIRLMISGETSSFSGEAGSTKSDIPGSNRGDRTFLGDASFLLHAAHRV